MKLYSNALDVLKEHDFKRYQIIAYRNIGQILDAKTDHVAALEYYQRAIKIAQDLNSRQSIAKVNGQIGWLYVEIQNDSLANVKSPP